VQKILVIEDHPRMRDNIVLLLQLAEYEVVSTADGRQGIELAGTEKPDLILCDVMMPGMDGYGVLRALRENKATAMVPFIFLTARGEHADQRAGIERGADDYLTKPVTKEELLSAVAAHLARKTVHHQRLPEITEAAPCKPDFSSAAPLETLGLTPREAAVLLWIAQGKSNTEIATILGLTESTVKKHASNILQKLGLGNRDAATERTLEVLSSPATPIRPRGAFPR
jgi:DNA-binding NarL/FixJ family response regulator